MWNFYTSRRFIYHRGLWLCCVLNYRRTAAMAGTHTHTHTHECRSLTLTLVVGRHFGDVGKRHRGCGRQRGWRRCSNLIWLCAPKPRPARGWWAGKQANSRLFVPASCAHAGASVPMSLTTSVGKLTSRRGQCLCVERDLEVWGEGEREDVVCTQRSFTCLATAGEEC